MENITVGLDRLASNGWDDLVEQLHTGAFPDLLDDRSQLLIGLFKVPFKKKKKEKKQIINKATVGMAQRFVNMGHELSLVSLQHLLF